MGAEKDRNEPSGQTPNCRERVFSEIKPFQTAHTVEYRVRENAGSGWVLTICEKEQGTRQEDSQMLTVDEKTAFAVRDVLYENAVPLENWRDVLGELLC